MAYPDADTGEQGGSEGGELCAGGGEADLESFDLAAERPLALLVRAEPVEDESEHGL